MAKFRLPKFNSSWVTPLILASIALHGLVLALPMPSLVEETPEPPEPTDPEVIKVVTLPKLATAPDSPEESFIPEPPPEEPPPVEEPIDELVLAEPEILEELKPAPIADEFAPNEFEHETEPNNGQPSQSDEDTKNGPPPEPTLDERLASSDSYNDYNSAHTGTVGEAYAITQTTDWSLRATGYELDLTPNHLTIPNLEVPLQECFQGNAPNSLVGVGILVSADGSLESEPELLGGSGYSVLDEKALEIARNVDYPETAEKTGYSLKIRVNYTRCS